MTLEELSQVVLAYPWFGQARKELCIKLLESGRSELAQEQISQAGMYVCSRAKLKADLLKIRPLPQAEPTVAPTPKEQKKVVVVGGDFFSQEQYDKIGSEADGLPKVPSFRPSPKQSALEPKAATGVELDSFCTEPMAQILLEQGYLAEAKYIYSKLLLRYPEKSAYFAALVSKIENGINNQ